MKVYGGMPMTRQGQRRAIVKAKSKASALRALDAAGLPVSTTRFRDYWAQTGNKAELGAMADKEPGTVLVKYDNVYEGWKG